MNSAEILSIHPTQSSLVAFWDMSQACFRCCWLTSILEASAGGENSGTFALSPKLAKVSLTVTQHAEPTHYGSTIPESCGRRSPFKSFEIKPSYLG